MGHTLLFFCHKGIWNDVRWCRAFYEGSLETNKTSVRAIAGLSDTGPAIGRHFVCPFLTITNEGSIFGQTVIRSVWWWMGIEQWWGTKWHSYIKPSAIQGGQPGFYGAAAAGHWALWALACLQTCFSPVYVPRPQPGAPTHYVGVS